MFNFPPPGGPPPASTSGMEDTEGNPNNHHPPPASRTNGPPPPAFRAAPGGFRPPPVAVAPSRSYSVDSHYQDDDDEDDGDGALGATINLVSSAASMFFRAAAPPPSQQQQQQQQHYAPPPVAQGSPMGAAARNPPPPIDPSSSMLESYSWDSQQQQQTPSANTFAPPPPMQPPQPGGMPPPNVPSSPLARSSPRVVIPPSSPITTAAVAQIPVPSLSHSFPPPKESPVAAAAAPMMPTLASTGGAVPSPLAAAPATPATPTVNTFQPPPPQATVSSQPPVLATAATSSKPPPRAFATPPPSPQVQAVAAPPSPATPLRSNHHGNTNGSSSNMAGTMTPTVTTNTSSSTSTSLRTPLPTPTSRYSLPTPSSSRRPLRAPPARSAASPRATPGRTKFKLPPPRKPRTPLASTTLSRREKEVPKQEEKEPVTAPATVTESKPVAAPDAPTQDVVEPTLAPGVEKQVEIPSPVEQEVASPEPAVVEPPEPQPVPTTESSLPTGWAQVVDPTSGQTYYYNETSQETSWERPGQEAAVTFTEQETTAPEADVAAIEVPVTEATTPELAVEASEPALEAVSTVPETIADTATPPLVPGWVEVVDPTSGQTYYYNETSQETSWERPTMPVTPTETSPELATEPVTMTEEDHDQPMEEEQPKEESAPELAVEEMPAPTPAEEVVPLVPETDASATTLPPGWTQVLDPTSGRPYYYNESTQETSWEPPVVPTGSSDAPEPLAVEENDDIPTEADPTPELAKEEPEVKPEEDLSAPESTLASGWEAVVDPTSGQTYYYNEMTQETSWDPPLALTTERAGEPEPGEAEESTPVEEAPVENELSVNEEVAMEDVGDAAPMEEEAGEASREPEADASVPESPTLFAGWVEVVDPSSGQTYYYNEETQETSWEPPTAPAEEELEEAVAQDENVDAHDGEPEVAAETPEVAQGDDKPPESEEPEAVASAPSTSLLPGWVEVVDPSSGQSYYYNEETQETSWEPPMAPPVKEYLDVVEDAAIDGTDEIEETPEVAESNEQHTESEVEPEVDSALLNTLLPGWVEVVDPSSGKTYYYNEETQETSWEPPTAPSTETVEAPVMDAVDVGEDDVDEREIVNDVDEAPETVDEGVAVEEPEVDTAAVPEVALLPGWVEVVDPSSGQTYFYNEDTQETSWEAPIDVPSADVDIDPVIDGPEAGMEVNEPEVELPSQAVETPEVDSDESEQDDAAAPESASEVAPGWVEVVDPCSGQKYYYNESTQETSWEPPLHAHIKEAAQEVDEPVNEQADKVEGEPTHERAPEVAVDNEEYEPQSAVESAPLSSEWEEVVDPTSGQTYYYNSSTQETSWEPPVEATTEVTPFEGTSTPQLTPEEYNDVVDLVAESADDLPENDNFVSERQGVTETLESVPSLPSGWIEVIEPRSGHVYFFNEVTQETSWKKPALDEVEPEPVSHEEDIPASDILPEDEDVIDEAPMDEQGVRSNPEGAAEARGNYTIAPGWEEVVDPTTGDTYYYNEETQETSWESPMVPTEGLDSSSPEQEGQTAEADVDPPETVLESKEVNRDPETEISESAEVAGWIESIDPTSGQTYYYNEITQETSWEPPIGFTGEAGLKLESEEQQEEQSESAWDENEPNVGNDEVASDVAEEDEPTPEQETVPNIKLAQGWTEVVDPSSGQTYYFNEVTQETFWDPPTEESSPGAEEPAQVMGENVNVDIINSEQEAMDELNEVPIIADESNGHVSEPTEAPVEGTAVPDDTLPLGWMEVVDPSSGQSYYYNEMTQETSWEPPMVSSAPAVEEPLNDADVMREDDTDEPIVEDNPEAIDEGIGMEQPEVDAAAVLEGWVEAVDPSSGQTYYYNEDTQETSWEPPTGAPSTDDVVDPTLESANEPEEELPLNVGETPEVDRDESEQPDDIAAPDSTNTLAPGWVEVVDPSTGQTYYYNESTQETSWEFPSDVPVGKDIPAASRADQGIVQGDIDISENEANTQAEALPDIVEPDLTLEPGWVEVVDPSTGQTYFYNESTQETSWDPPLNRAEDIDAEPTDDGSSPVLSSEIAEAPSTIELLKEQEAAKIDDVFASLNEEFQMEDTGDESEANVGAEPDGTDTEGISERSDDPASGEADPELVVLPEFWTQAVDPDTGKTYYFNTLTQETSWKPPEGSIVPSDSKEKTDPQELPASDADDTLEPYSSHEQESPDQIATQETPSVQEESETAVGQTEEDSPANHLMSGWTKAVDPQTGGEYYYNPETGETSWESPVAAQTNLDAVDQTESNEIDGPDELPSGWVIMVDDQTGEAYYYNEITQETSWELPMESQDLKDPSSDVRADVDHLPSTEEQNPPRSEEEALDVDATTKLGEKVSGIRAPMEEDEDAMTQAPLPVGWVEAIDPDSGTTYFFNEVSNETTWDRPTEGVNNIDDSNAYGEDGGSSDLPDGWTEIIDEDSGKVYYLNELENTTTWEKPTTTETAPEVPTEFSSSYDKGASNEIKLSDEWVEIVDPQSGDTYYLNTETNETSWVRPSGGKSNASMAVSIENRDMGGTLDDWVDVARNQGANDQPKGNGAFLAGILSDTESQGVMRANSELVRDVIQRMNEARTAKSIVGPLASATDAQVLAYITNKASSPNEGILWKLIAIAAESRGRLRSDEGVFSPNSPESAIVKLLLDDSNGKDSAQIDDEVHRANIGVVEKEKATTELQQLLLAGKRKEAVEAAIKCQDFATALLVGTMCDSETYKMATTAFAANAFASGSPMQTVAMLFAGSLQDPGFVGAESAHWGTDGAELKQNWKKHLAGVISNRVAGWDGIVLSLGDRLRDIGEVEGAHFCYMVCGCPVSSPCMEGTRIALLGCEHKSCEDQLLATKESLEAFERTEAYEWAKRQGNKNAVLRSFFPLKLIFAAHLIDCGLENVATSHVKCVRDFMRQHVSQSVGEEVTLASLFDDENTWSFLLEELEKRLGCYEEPIGHSEGVSVLKGTTTSGEPNPINKPDVQNPIANNDEPSEPSFRFDQPNPLDSTFVSAKSNLLDVTGYTLDSPLKPDNINQKISDPPMIAPPSSLKVINESNSDKQALTQPPKQVVPPSPVPPVTKEPQKQEEKMPPVAMMTPQASGKQKPRAAPSTAPSVLMGKKSSEKSGSQSAPSSAGKKGGWSLRQRLVKWINPDATEVVLPDNEEKPYYDEKRKVWVFPGDNPDELVKPVAPPPTAMQKSTEPAAPEPETSNDPLAAMMAPPRRGPSTLQRPGRASATPRTPGTPAGMPMPNKAGAASPMPGGAPPKFAVFQPVPKPTQEQQES
eukprot:Nitzschia sp. Nitz4//scaffold34_size148208//91553//101858//NITZ4_002988-RA/size148208-snap-gene-0.209-mRNA-1//1//CDS//3329548819//8512//frame0